MAKQIQFRGGTTAQHSVFTGAIREITVDTDKDTLVVHDGSTVGGFPLVRESVVNTLLDTKVDKNADIVAGTGTKITYDSKGLVKSSTTLSASDIPSLDASKITTGTLSLNTTGSAAKITTARNIAITGDITWSTSFDGSANVTGVGTLANSGVTDGTYKSVTVDSKGRVTSGTNPTTLSGYGITDATPSSHVGSTGASHGVATTSVNGFMSSTDKSKLNNSTSSNTASTIVARDASGNFSAGTITANLTGTASNADLFDGSESTLFLQSKNLGNGDVNSILTSGMYRLEASANSPIGGYGNILSVRGSASPTTLADTIGQIAFDYDTGEHYIRGGQIGNPGGLSYLPTVPWGKILTSITPLGYASGTGGVVVQATSKTTAVILNKLCGDITMHNSALAPGQVVYFQFVNSFISIGDMVDISFVASGIDNTKYYCFDTPDINGGLTYIAIKNVSTETLADSLRLRFSIRKGAIS